MWKDVPGLEGRYQVSDDGQVRSLDQRVRLVTHGIETTRIARGQILRPGPQKSGHLTVMLGRGNSRQVHDLVAQAFIGARPAGFDIAHNDGDPTNNAVENLRYATRADNNKDKVFHGKTRLTPAQVDRIRKEAATLPHGGKKKLAESFGISPTGISDVLAGRSYAHV